MNMFKRIRAFKTLAHRARQFGVAIVFGISVFGGVAYADMQPKAVVELFTSQGCSSCPPADKILARYAKSSDILALSFHVDYWNYLGWKDTFSQAQFTERQQRYAVSFNRPGVYTPQAVVNGRDHAVGSREKDIQALMAGYDSSNKGLTVPVKTAMEGDGVRVTADVSSGEATLWLVYFDKEKKVVIERGENRGKTITYHNVVRDMAMAGMMKAGKLNVTLPIAELKRKGVDGCAILLQKTTSKGTPGAIVGATVLRGL